MESVLERLEAVGIAGNSSAWATGRGRTVEEALASRLARLGSSGDGPESPVPVSRGVDPPSQLGSRNLDAQDLISAVFVVHETIGILPLDVLVDNAQNSSALRAGVVNV